MEQLAQLMWWTVPVPRNLIFDSSLPAASRALYMIALDQCDPIRHTCRLTSVMQLSGMRDRRAVMKHIRPLAEQGWLTVDSPPRSASAQMSVAPAQAGATKQTLPVPGALVRLQSLPLQTRLLYAVILGHCSQSEGSVAQHHRELLEQTGAASPQTLRKQVAQLHHAGWLLVTKRHGSAGSSLYTPLDPHLATRRDLAGEVQLRIERASFKGEAILKEFLTIVVEDQYFVDHARFGTFVNPLTGERLELDRVYPNAHVAIEFNGPQHYRTTKMFPDPVKVSQQQARDLMKAGLATQHGLTLLTFIATDLTPEAVLAKIKPHLPVRPVRAEDPVYALISSHCRDYIRTVRRIRRRTVTTRQAKKDNGDQ